MYCLLLASYAAFLSTVELLLDWGAFSFFAASWSSSVSTSEAGIWIYRTTLPRMKQFFILYQRQLWNAGADRQKRVQVYILFPFYFAIYFIYVSFFCSPVYTGGHIVFALSVGLLVCLRQTLTFAITFAILKIATWYLACMCFSWSCTFWVMKGQGHPSRSKVKITTNPMEVISFKGR